MQLSHQESSHICIKLRWALYSTRIDDDNLVFLVWSQLLQQQCCRNPQSGCKIHRLLKGNKQQSWGPSGSKNLIQWLTCVLGFSSPIFFIKAIPQNFSLRLWSAIWNSELLAIISYLGLGWQNAIIISVPKNIGPGEYSSGLWKCRFPLGAIWHRPSLLRQLAKNNLTVFPCLVKPQWSKMLDQLS